jgi:hypothetical protein
MYGQESDNTREGDHLLHSFAQKLLSGVATLSTWGFGTSGLRGVSGAVLIIPASLANINASSILLGPIMFQERRSLKIN